MNAVRHSLGLRPRTVTHAWKRHALAQPTLHRLARNCEMALERGHHPRHGAGISGGSALAPERGVKDHSR